MDWEISTHGHLLCCIWTSVDWHRTQWWGGCGSANLPSLWWAGSKRRDTERGTRHILSSHQAPQLTVISASNSLFNHEEIKSWCQSFHDPSLKHMSLLGSQAITTYKCKPMWRIITVFSKNNFIFANGRTPACVLACVCTLECKHLSNSEMGIGSLRAQVPGCFESPNKETAKVVCSLNPGPSLQPLHRVFRGVPFSGPGAHHLSRTVSEQGSSFLCLLRSAVTDVRCWGYRCALPCPIFQLVARNQVLVLAWQIFYWLSHVSSSNRYFLINKTHKGIFKCMQKTINNNSQLLLICCISGVTCLYLILTLNLWRSAFPREAFFPCLLRSLSCSSSPYSFFLWSLEITEP